MDGGLSLSNPDFVVQVLQQILYVVLGTISCIHPFCGKNKLITYSSLHPYLFQRNPPSATPKGVTSFTPTKKGGGPKKF